MMERLTTRVNGVVVAKDGCHAFIRKTIDRLAYYEDMEEQGRLVVLEKKEHQADVLQYYKNYRDRLERYENALKGGAN